MDSVCGAELSDYFLVVVCYGTVLFKIELIFWDGVSEDFICNPV